MATPGGSPDPDRPRIFGIGLNKTGTTSFGEALIILGFKSLHFGGDDAHRSVQRAIDEGVPLLTHLDPTYDAFSDIGLLSRRFQMLDQQYPGSRFVLTTRPRSDWIDSRRRHVERNLKKQARGEYDGTFLVVDEEKWANEWDHHHQRVRGLRQSARLPRARPERRPESGPALPVPGRRRAGRAVSLGQPWGGQQPRDRRETARPLQPQLTSSSSPRPTCWSASTRSRSRWRTRRRRSPATSPSTCSRTPRQNDVDDGTFTVPRIEPAVHAGTLMLVTGSSVGRPVRPIRKSCSHESNGGTLAGKSAGLPTPWEIASAGMKFCVPSRAAPIVPESGMAKPMF